MADIDTPTGKLQLTEDPTGLRWGTPQDFLRRIERLFKVIFPFVQGATLLIRSFQTPSEDLKANVWWRQQVNGSDVGPYTFQNGQWRRFFNYTADDVIWKTGDSRNIPEGFALIDGSLPNIDIATQQFIVGQYRIDPAAFPLINVYTYFAVVWVGY